MKIKVLGKRILIRPTPLETVSLGGLHLPQTDDRPIKGKVLSLGAEVEGLTVGNQVMYGKYAGQEIEVDGEKLLIMREEDVMAVLQ